MAPVAIAKTLHAEVKLASIEETWPQLKAGSRLK